MSRYASFVSVAAVLAAGPAFAQQATDWSGFYAGLTAGVVNSTSSVDNPDWNFFGQIGPDQYEGPIDLSGASAAGGAEAGFNFQFNNVVLGIEGDFNALNAKSNYYYFDPSYECDYACGSSIGITTELNNLETLRGRVGITAGNALVYGTAGLAVGKVTTTIEEYNASEDWWAGGSATSTAWGWTAGAGVEYALDSHWSAKAEALYYDLKPQSIAENVADEYADYKNHVTGSVLKLGLNYKF